MFFKGKFEIFKWIVLVISWEVKYNVKEVMIFFVVEINVRNILFLLSIR